jgi:hypothetical protein
MGTTPRPEQLAAESPQPGRPIGAGGTSLSRRVPRAGVAAAYTALALLALAAAGQAAVSPSRWCGPGEAVADLADTGGNAFEVHVVYAYPADGTDRFASLSLGIARDVAAIDTWWRAQDSSHTPRFDLAAFPGCDTAFGQLDITAVKLPRPTGYYSSLDTVLTRLADDLDEAPNSLGDPDKKYLVLYDGALQQPGGDYVVCGLSPARRSEGGGASYAAVFLTSPCGDGLGAATNTAGAMAHELIHNLGALVSPGPPHACPDTPGHPCDSDADVLSATGEYGRILTELQLDVGRDDYYGHSGTWWDIQDSVFLDRVGQTLGTPSGPSGLKGSNAEGKVLIAWQAATSPNGAIVKYRIARDGVPIGTASEGGVYDDVEPLSSHTWTVQAQDALGFLGTPQTIRYTLTAAAAPADTAPPTRPTGLRATRAKSGGIVLSWRPSTDRVGVTGYRVARNGVVYRGAVKTTSLAVPGAKAKGVWVVIALDAAGNASGPSASLRVA